MRNGFRFILVLTVLAQGACGSLKPLSPPRLIAEVEEVNVVPASTALVNIPTFSGAAIPLKVNFPRHYLAGLRSAEGKKIHIRLEPQVAPGECIGIYVSKEQLDDQPILTIDQAKVLASSYCRGTQ